MLGIENFTVFLTAGILLNLYPGPDSLYILARSISQGRVAGVFAVLGISTGSLFHTLIGSAGFSALLFSSASTFSLIKYAGAAYLFYQALLMLRDSLKTSDRMQLFSDKKSMWKIYRRGALTNILNPKVALFFMALLPQFISAQSSSKPLAFLLLGMVFVLTGTLWCLLLALFASFFSRSMRKNPRVSQWLLRINAGLFGYLGIQLASASFQNQS